MAEREGFEPSEGLLLHRFSKPALSATQPSLRTIESMVFVKLDQNCDPVLCYTSTLGNNEVFKFNSAQTIWHLFYSRQGSWQADSRKSQADVENSAGCVHSIR
jgi:hypothetical protein